MGSLLQADRLPGERTGPRLFVQFCCPPGVLPEWRLVLFFLLFTKNESVHCQLLQEVSLRILHFQVAEAVYGCPRSKLR